MSWYQVFFSLWMLTHNTHLRHYSLDTYYIIHFVFSLNTNATVFLCAFLAWEQQKSQGTKRKNGKERRRILKDYTTPDSSKNRLQNTLCLHCPNITHLCNLTDYKILILAREWVDNKGFGSPVHCLGKLIHNITVGAETLDRNTIGCTQGC